MNPHPPGSGRGRTFRPCLERLEDRYQPSVNFAVAGNTLIVFAPTTSTPVNATITIFDNGSQNPNNVVAVAATPFYPAVTIDNVVIELFSGNDHVNYVLTGPLTGNRAVSATLNTGRDTFQAAGGDLLSGSSLSFAINANPRHGGDNITGQFDSNVQAGATLSWTSSVSSGKGILGFNMIGAVAAGGNVFVNQFGGNRGDEITTTYRGLLDGTLGLQEFGGQGNNDLFADVGLNAGSTGTLIPSLLQGQDGNDQLAFFVRDPTHRAIIYNQILDGGPGFNVCARTSNVMAFDCAVDGVLP
jgi:hypothetical protein